MDTATTAFLIAAIPAPSGEPASCTPPDWVFLAMAPGWAFTVFLAVQFLSWERHGRSAPKKPQDDR